MWHLQFDWMEIVIRAASVFGFLFFTFRVWGKKHIGQLAPFDFILLLIISETVQNAIAPPKSTSLPAAAISVLTLIFINSILNKLSYYSPTLEKIIQGTPKILIKDGVVNDDILRKEAISKSELAEALREHGVADVSEVHQGTLETDGDITVIKRKSLGARA